MSWSHSFSPEDCGLSGYKDVAGTSGENPEHRSYWLLKVRFFFFLPGLKHCFSQLPVTGYVLLSEEERESDSGDLVSSPTT